MLKTTIMLAKTPVLRAEPIRPQVPFKRRRVKSTLLVNLSIVALALLVVAILLADVLAPYNPISINLRARLAPPLTITETSAFLLGTDTTGRDILSRILHGGRVSLVVAGISTLLGLVLGTVLGILSGYLRGWVDTLIMYFVDVQLSLPFVLLAVAVSLVLGTTPGVLIGLAALSTWPLYARVVRGVVLALREREFVVAARALGASQLHIMRIHLLPNLAAPILVLATLNIGRIVLLESGLSFLGIGIQPPTPSWGGIINEGRDYLASAWWIATMPGIALIVLTMSIGTIGDWLRDLMDVSIN